MTVMSASSNAAAYALWKSSTARVRTRLEDGPQSPPAEAEPQCLQGQLHRGRVMGEVIEHRHTLWLTDDLLPAANARIGLETSREILGRQAFALESGDGGHLVVEIVLADQERSEHTEHLAIPQDTEGHASSARIDRFDAAVQS